MPMPLKHKERPKSVSVAKVVQQKLQAKVDQLKRLEIERHQLLNREQILWQGIDQQECIVYHLGLLLSEELSKAKEDEGNPDSHHAENAATLAAMLNDVRALQMKSGVGSGPSSGRGTRRLYTSQLLCAAITPENVAYIKKADIEKELVPRFRTMTMRLSYLLSTTVDESLLSDSLSQKVDEYSELVQLLHTAADDKLLSLGLYNFETMEQEFPPHDHWDMVCERVGLRPEQEEELAIGFNWYAARRTELIGQLSEAIQKLQQLMNPLYLTSKSPEEGQSNEQASADTPAATNGVAGAAATYSTLSAGASLQQEVQQQQQLQQNDKVQQEEDEQSAGATGLQGLAGRSSSFASNSNSSLNSGTRVTPHASSAVEPSAAVGGPGAASAGPADSQAALGVLDLETAEELQQVLGEVDRLNRAIREVDRFCVYLSINALDKRQLALSAIYSYPYLVQPPACCEVIARTVAKRRAAQVALAPDNVPTIPVVNSNQLCEALQTNKTASTGVSAAAVTSAAATAGAAARTGLP